MTLRPAGGVWKWIWIAIGVVLVIFVGVIHLFWRESTQVLNSQLKQRLARAQSQMVQGTLAPSPETYAFLHRRTQQLGEQYDHLLAVLDPPGRVSTEDAQDLGLYFREQLHTLEKQLERKAAAKGMAVTSEFGFPEDLPSPERVPLLLRQLALVDAAASTFITEGALAIDLLRAMDPKPVEDPRTHEAFLWELPVVVRAHCATPTLVKFLYRMQQAGPLVAVPEISLKEARPTEEGLNVEVLLVTYAAISDAPVHAAPATRASP